MSISDRDLEAALEGVDARAILMVVDACQSGQALESDDQRRGPMNSRGLAQLAYEKGMYVAAAAQSYQAALEATEFGHGLLTFSLVEEGLVGWKADVAPPDGLLTIREWLDYAADRVPQLLVEKMNANRGLTLDAGRPPTASVQVPRIFYRREPERDPPVIAVRR